MSVVRSSRFSALVSPHAESADTPARSAPALTVAVAAAMAMMSHTAYSQQAAETARPQLEEIVVTGTRIARDPNAVSPVPVQVVSGEDIARSGKLNAADVLREVPALLTSVSSESSVDSVFNTGLPGTTVGQSVLQLRGMGAERTLTLVNGRRHVGGVAGTSSVDVASIPAALIERVEVLTGGASALYGADAVTGVINFIMKDDFEGLEFDVQGGLSSRGDAGTYGVNALWGTNFADGRGNVAIVADYQSRGRLLFGDRGFSRDNGIARNLPNPDRRFQQGDIDPASMPNLAALYSLDTGRFPYGFAIPSVDGFTSAYTSAFGAAPTLTAAEIALIERGQNAPTRAIRRQPAFAISSAGGLIAPGDFGNPAIDLDGDGVPDCEQSYVGYNSSFDFPFSFGAAGGCWTTDAAGNLRPFQDGAVSGVFNQFGGDGIAVFFDPEYLRPAEDKVVVNLLSRYDLTPTASAFVEAKYGYQTVDYGTPYNTFWDLLTIFPDNPFIPAPLQDLADDTGQLWMTRDITELGPAINRNQRETVRMVLGVDGEFTNGWRYEVAANFGQFDQVASTRNRVIVDRFFAAVDATTDGAGNPICRSDIDPTPPPTTPFGIPGFDPGFFTFNPGDGQCQPANLFGIGNVSQEAIDFITTTTRTQSRLEQMVFSGFVTGNTEEFFTLPAGPVGFAVGAEWREEKSRTIFDPLARGILPVDSPAGPAGTPVSELGLTQVALVFDPESQVANSRGSYDVWDVFGEVSVPLLADRPGFRELTFDAAARYSRYSTVGGTVTWKTGLTWTPVEDVRFRGGYSEAVRAPNISELFDPDQGAFFRPTDPCDQAEIDALLASGDPRGAIREGNCRADGIPVGYQDPLSARFSGVSGGNPDLEEETAKTFTIGAVFQPRFVPGLTLSVDYWNIEIEDAISAVSSNDIVSNCYDSVNFPDNQYCGLFTRNRDATSPQFLGFNFLRQTQVNFGAIEGSGYDFTSRYQFALGSHEFALTAGGTYMNELDYFFDPADPTALDPELVEIQRPRLAGQIGLSWRSGPFSAGWATRYMSKQGLRGVEIETLEQLFGDAGIVGSFTVHDLTLGYEWSDSIDVYGGVNNVGDRLPFITEQAYPVSPIGRNFFLGVTARF